MTPPKTPATPAHSNPKPADAPAAQAATPVQAPQTASTPAAGKPEKGDADRRIVSVGFPSKLARQLKLLSSVSGESIASIVVASVTRTIAKRLPGALEAIAKSADVDDEG